MAVVSRYSSVLDASGRSLNVRDALTLIIQTLDELAAATEDDFDSDTRWAIAWFEQQGFIDGEYGMAEQLSKSKNTSVAGMVEAKILNSKGGRVRLLKPDELSPTWDPLRDSRLTVWEIAHHLIRALSTGGERAAADLMSKLGAQADAARDLSYRLYTIARDKKRTAEAVAYNSLVQSWPEIARLAADTRGQAPLQPVML
jgi:putative DNA methylase